LIHLLIDVLVSAVVFLPLVGGTISIIFFTHLVVVCVWSVFGGRNLIGDSAGALGGKARARVEIGRRVRRKKLRDDEGFEVSRERLTLAK
jgi:hypothetical protein